MNSRHFFANGLLWTFVLMGICACATHSNTSQFVACDSGDQWIKRGSYSDLKFAYYVGMGEGRSFRVAQETATLAAQETAIRENYGTYASISINSRMGLNSHSLYKAADDKSDIVRFVDFRRVKLCSEPSARVEAKVWALYKYPKDEIKQEKIRIAKLPRDNRSVAESSDNEEECRGGSECDYKDVDLSQLNRTDVRSADELRSLAILKNRRDILRAVQLAASDGRFEVFITRSRMSPEISSYLESFGYKVDVDYNEDHSLISWAD